MKIKLVLAFISIVFICFGQSVDHKIIEIRNEYNLINSNQNLSKDSIGIFGESTEGGYMCTYKDLVGNNRKIICSYFGETGKAIIEYYLKNDKLIFVLIQRYEYNRPFYWDEKMAKENGDSIVFDDSKTKISENRYYFDNSENIIQWIDINKKTIIDKQKLDSVKVEIISEYNKLRTKNK